MSNGTVERFEALDLSKYPEISQQTKPLLQGLWVLYIAEVVLNIKKMQIDEIVDVLKKIKRVSLSVKIPIIRAFATVNGEKVDKEKDGYSILDKGIKEVDKLQSSKSKVHYTEFGKPYTTRKKFKEIIDGLEGEIRCVDEYIGPGIFDLFFDKNVSVKILTGNKENREKKQALIDYKALKAENKFIELRIYEKEGIHDRFILTDDDLIVVGQSIKDLGKSEGFIHHYKKDDIKGIYDLASRSFDSHWNNAKTIE